MTQHTGMNTTLILMTFAVPYMHVHRLDHQVRLGYVPPPKELEKALATRFIRTMASSAPDQPVIKFFLYAQHVSLLIICAFTSNKAFA